MTDVAAALNVYDAMSGFYEATKQTRGIEWRKAHPDAWAVVSDVLKLEEEYGA